MGIIKYVDTSLSTGANDGTSLANAWQSLKAVLTNTMSGSYAGGDTIYVRTHDGANDCYETYTSSWNMSVPASVTKDAPLDVVFDDGSVWAGDSGVFRFKATGNYKITTTGFVNFLGKGNNWGVHYDSTGYYGDVVLWAFAGECVCKGYTFSAKSGQSINNFFLFQTASGMSGKALMIIDPKYILPDNHGTDTRLISMWWAQSGVINIINPVIDLSGMTVANNIAIFDDIYGSQVRLTGGKIVQPDTQAKRSVVHLFTYNAHSSINLQIDGFELHPDNKLSVSYNNDRVGSSSGNADYTKIAAIGLRGEDTAFIMKEGLMLDFQKDNYPYLNSRLPNATSTPWSYRVRPYSFFGLGHTAELINLSKYYDQAAGTKTITFEFLFNIGYASFVTKRNLFLSVGYWGTDGVYHVETTFDPDGAAIDQSSESWSNDDTYGAQSYYKYKVALTTSVAIKQYTDVLVRVQTSIPYIGADKFYFIDPDLVIG